MRNLAVVIVIGSALAMLGASCQQSEMLPNEARNEAIQKVQERKSYVQQNDIEFLNYDRRQRLADDPTTILWCTSAFPIASSPMFTVPIVGKLTSGNKRPYATSWAIAGAQGRTDYNPELPGPDGMFGSSGEYRFGFTPGGVYADFYGLDTFCTTEPTVWQRQNTAIVNASDAGLLDAQRRAQALLKAGKPEEANKVLEAAIKEAAK